MTGNITLDDYNNKLIIDIAESVNVNMSIYSGTLIRMACERLSLIVINCVRHCLQLAIKDLVKNTPKFHEYD